MIEFGANVGMNLKAIQLLFPNVQLSGVEINKKAAAKLAEVIDESNVFNDSIFNYESVKNFDVSLIKGF